MSDETSPEVSGHRAGESGIAGIARRHSLASFFVLAYGMTWLAWSPFLLSENGFGLLHFRFPEIGGDAQLVGILPGAYLGPLSSAFIVTAVAGGRTGLRHWRRRLFRWRFNWRWYAFAVGGVPLLLLVAALVMPGALQASRWPSVGVLLAYPLLLLLQTATTGVAEEPGWRDFALPRMQRRRGPLVGTLILGVLWGGWHLPLFFTDWEPEGPDPLSISLFILVAITLSVVITWVFNRTQESLPAAMLVHASNNTFFSGVFPALFPSLDTSAGISIVSIIAYGGFGLVLIAATRGRLGYKGGEQTGVTTG
jgi:membrane protease YdiL (CAAX protease family)